jgi:hypothetical protein
MAIKLKKETDMKKILAFIILSIAMVSCYENYIYDFTYTSIYFPYTTDVRTVVVGEGMHFDVGAALGGVRSNTKDRNVSFILDNSLINAAQLLKMQTHAQAYIKNPTLPVAALQLLPSNYYTITNSSTMVIKSGQHEGGVTIRPDSVTFLNDSLKTMYSTYVLPFRITAADADSIMYSKKTNVVGVRFENMLFGNYWHGGAAKVPKVGTNTDSATIVYRWAVNDIATKIWTLTTFGPNTLYTNGYFNLQTAKNELKLVLKGSTVFLSTAAASPGLPLTAPTNTYVQDGPCTFNQAKLLQNRKIFLKYSFVSGKYTYHCTDTIYFRNRIRDGVNEWQDENPAHYTK